jgi:hypothetical protein
VPLFRHFLASKVPTRKAYCGEASVPLVFLKISSNTVNSTRGQLLNYIFIQGIRVAYPSFFFDREGILRVPRGVVLQTKFANRFLECDTRMEIAFLVEILELFFAP